MLLDRDASTRLVVPARAAWLLVVCLYAGGLNGGLAASTVAAQGETFDDCQRFYRAGHPDWRCCSCFHRVARSTGDWQTAARALERLAQQDDNPWLRFYLGRLRQDYAGTGAAAWYQQAAESFERSGELEGALFARINLLRLAKNDGDFAAAEIELRHADQAASALGTAASRAQVEIERAGLVEGRGEDMRSALAILHQVETLARGSANPTLEAEALSRSGRLSYSLGRYAQARATYQRLTELHRDRQDRYGEAAALHALAQITLAGSSTPRFRELARQAFSAAFEAARRAGHDEILARCAIALARLQTVPNAGELLRQAVALARARGTKSLEIEALFAQARGQLDEQPALARRTLDRALEVAATSDDPWALAYGWDEWAQVQWVTESESVALTHSLRMLDYLESLRARQLLEGGRSELFSVWSEAFYWTAGRLLLAGEASGRRDLLGHAHLVAERLRARSLLESRLADRSAAGPTAADPTSLELGRRIVALRRRLLAERLSPEEVEEAERHLGQAALALERGGEATSTTADLLALEELEVSLHEDEALLSFLVAPWSNIYGDFEGGSWLIVSTRRGSRAYRLPDAEELAAATHLLVGLVEQRQGDAAAALALPFFGRLLAEPLADLDHRIVRLILVPDGALHRLPWSALRIDGHGTRLTDRYPVAVVPSATLWQRWRGQASPTLERAALVLVDPVSEPGAPSLPGDGRNLEREALGKVGRLPYARLEANALRGELARGVSVLEGKDASESALKAAPPSSYSLLHFATHAVVDDENPRRSAILLAAGDLQEDGLLEPGEIALLDLKDKLVVLSACRGAGGTLLRGEGVMSLARSFFQAGARAVVGSLWLVRDDEAALLFAAFYRELARGHSVAGALARSQQRIAESGAPAAAWAGFVVLGDGDLRLEQGRRSWTGWLVSGALLLATAIIVRWRRRGLGRRS